MTTTNKIKKANQRDDNQVSAMRFSKEVTLALKNEVTKLNKLKKGSGRISASDILEQLLPLFNDDLKKQLLSKTVTSKDRQVVAFTNYSKKYKKTSKNDFLELVQYGEINIDDYLPDEMKRQKLARNINKLGVA